jgi:hypothetical protein
LYNFLEHFCLFELISFFRGDKVEEILFASKYFGFWTFVTLSCGSWHGDNGSSNSFATIRLLFIVDRRRKSGCVEHVKQANSRLKISQLKTSVRMLRFLFEMGNFFRLNWWVFYEWRHEEYQVVIFFKANILSRFICGGHPIWRHAIWHQLPIVTLFITWKLLSHYHFTLFALSPWCHLLTHPFFYYNVSRYPFFVMMWHFDCRISSCLSESCICVQLGCF